VARAYSSVVRSHLTYANVVGPITLCLAATCVLSAGCGGSERVTKAQTIAYARRVNLREGDVPGMTAVYFEYETTAGTLALKLARCGSDLPGWDAGSIRSVSLEHALFQLERATPLPPLEAFYSAIKVAPTATAAVRNLTVNRSPRVQACIATAWASVSPSTGPLTRRSSSVSVLRNRLLNASGSIGLTLTERLAFLEANPRPPEHTLPGKRREQNRRRAIAIDILGFASGRAEVTLTVLHEAGRPPRKTERRLLALLYGRAKAHEL
jgi:hypothetical protein